MPFVQARCTNCGAGLKVDSSKEAAVCPYCGTAYVVEKAIHNYNVTNHITAQTVNVYGDSSQGFQIEAGVLKKYTGADRDVVIPNGVVAIDGHAFEGPGLRSVVLPESMTEIGYNAFSGCTGLTRVTIPRSVTKIGRDAFWCCTGLADVTIPGSVTEIGYNAFSGCTGLTRVTIPRSVTKINNLAFQGCTGLTGVAIPDSVREIGAFAFHGCTGLTSVVIPNSVRELSVSVFRCCSGLTSVTIPGSVTVIRENAFQGCTGLTSVVIPGSVTELGDLAFLDCTRLTNVTLPPALRDRVPRVFQNTPYLAAQQAPPKRSGGCYVATAVYGSYDCPQVWTLRRFRDDTLAEHWYGRAFIRTYYALSPTLVRWFGDTGWFRALWRPRLDRLVERLNRRGVADTPYEDRSW